MDRKFKTRRGISNESGAALVTVLMISVLLLTASIGMLAAIGASSRNTTDILFETKAYYAAESGIQATINVLRNGGITYKQAVADPDLSTWLPYNYPTSGTATRAVIGEPVETYLPNTGAAYSIVLTDPDNSAASTTYITSGSITGATETGIRFGNDEDSTTISYQPKTTPTVIDHLNPPLSVSLGSFQIEEMRGSGAPITDTRFMIVYQMTLPRPGTISIGGVIKPGSANNEYKLKFDSTSYTLYGGSIVILNGLETSSTALPTDIRASIQPVAPYRLKVVSTGFGPNGSIKKLEAVVRQNLFDGVASGAATSLIGAPCPVGVTCFAPGTSNGITYNGCPPPPCVGCAQPACVPSFGLTDPDYLAYVASHPPGNDPAQMQPPPALLSPTMVPEWQSSPAALDALIDQIRTSAQNSGRYFVSPVQNVSDPGSFEDGTGITFCEGSCKVSGSGGGILVVTGMLTNVGGFSFKGLIIVTGEEGWERNGGGNGQVIGNIVIAPYNRTTYVPENLSATFLAPMYKITGGGGSDVISGDLTASFDNTSGISDFVLGVAEK